MRLTAVAEIRCSGWGELRQPVETVVGAGAAAAAAAAVGYDGLDAVVAVAAAAVDLLPQAEDAPVDDATG